MNLDGITLHSAVEELSQDLTGGQITKIYQLNGRGLYFRVFNAGCTDRTGYVFTQIL